MVVRVRVKLTLTRGKSVGAAREAVCVANAGYESLKPEMMIPDRLAEVLGLLPELPEGARSKIYRTAAGPIRICFVDECIEAKVVAEDRMSELVKCGIAISELEDEVLLSDKLISAFGIAIEDAGEGLWRFRDEPPSKLRRSYPPELW